MIRFRLIQLILLAGFISSLFVYLRFLRSSLRDRLAVIIVFMVVCIAVLDPNLTNEAAMLVGVGRGTDLTLYLFLVGFVFFSVLTHSKIDGLNRALSEVVRRTAIIEHGLPDAAADDPTSPPAPPQRGRVTAPTRAGAPAPEVGE